jgi:hypothetical protein
MIVSYVIGEEPFQMSFVHGDDVIQEISPTAPDPGSGSLGALRIQREIVRSETSKPSMRSSP